jgi:hypothetical protein
MVGYMSGRNRAILILHQNNNITNNRKTINLLSPKKIAATNNIRERAIVWFEVFWISGLCSLLKPTISALFDYHFTYSDFTLGWK